MTLCMRMERWLFAHHEPDTQGLYVAVEKVAPLLPSPASHPHPRGSHSARAWLGGSWIPFVVRDSLGRLSRLWLCGPLFPQRREGGEKIERERAKGRWGTGEVCGGGGYQKRVKTQTALLTSSPIEGEDEREKGTWTRWSKIQNEIRQKCHPPTPPQKKNTFPPLRHRCYLHLRRLISSTPPYPFPPSAYVWALLFSSITSFCPLPHPSSPSSHPAPLLYTHSIIWETRLREMSGVGAIIIITSFRYSLSYSCLYGKQTFKS